MKNKNFIVSLFVYETKELLLDFIYILEIIYVKGDYYEKSSLF